MFRRLIGAVLSLVLVLPASAQQFYVVGSPASHIPFQSQGLPGGGFIVGLENLGGIPFARTDSFGGYIHGTDNKWHPTTSNNSFSTAACEKPTYVAVPSCAGIYPTSGATQSFQFPSGVISQCISPANPTIAFEYGGDGNVYKSTNISQSAPESDLTHNTWVNVNQLGGSGFFKSAGGTTDSSNTALRMNGPFIACDPNNPDHVLLSGEGGTGTTGLGLVYETLNGGIDWASIATSDIPATTSTNYAVIVFDKNSGTCTPAGYSAAVTCYVYIFTLGAPAGFYASFTGGATTTWTQISGVTPGGPRTISHAAIPQSVNSNSSDHLLWAVDNVSGGSGGAVWTYAPGLTPPSTGVWTTVLLSTVAAHSVAINPAHSDHVMIQTNSGTFVPTTTGVAGFGGTTPVGVGVTKAPGDSPWLTAGGLIPGDLVLDSNDNLLLTAGQGAWSSPGPMPVLGGGNITLTANVLGVTQPNGMGVVLSKSLTPITGYLDLGLCTISVATFTPPTACSPIEPIVSLTMAGGLDVSRTDRNFVVARLSGNPSQQGFELSGWSTDGYTATYNIFNDWTAVLHNADISSNAGEVHVLLNNAPPGLVNWSAGAGTILCTRALANTGGPNSFTGTGSCYGIHNLSVIGSVTEFDMLGSTIGTVKTSGVDYTLYRPTNPLSNWKGSLNIYNITNVGGTNAVRVTYDIVSGQNGGALLTGSRIQITGTASSGVNIDGFWIATNPIGVTGNVGTIDLRNSTFPGGSYVSGGTVNTVQPSGGSIAAASDTNIIQAAALGTIPQCTTDGGKTWTPLTPTPLLQTTVTGGPYAVGTTAIPVASVTGIAATTELIFDLDDGSQFYGRVASIASLTLTLNVGVPANRSILGSGSNVYSITTGWQQNGNASASIVTADYVHPNTFYLANVNIGLVKVHGGLTCSPSINVNNDTLSLAGHWLKDGGGAVHLKAVPGESGHLFWSVGSNGAPSGLNANDTLWRVCNGDNDGVASPGQNGPVVMHQFPGMFAPWNVGLGKAKPGSAGYASIYVFGWYDKTGAKSAAVSQWGLWESTDDPNHGNSSSVGVDNCKDTSASFTSATIAGTALHIAGTITGTPGIHIGDGVLGANHDITDTVIVSGSGNDWVVSKSQTVASETMTTGGTFHFVTDWPSILPGGAKVTIHPSDVTGDPDVYGPVYWNTGGGAFWGTVN